METLETRSAYRHRGSMPALRFSLSLWVRLDFPTHPHNPHFYARENEWEQDNANAKVSAHTGLICFIFLICSLRTNIVFFLIFLTLVGAFGCLSAAYWNLALAYENAENMAAAKRAGQLVVVRLPFSLPSPSPLFLLPSLALPKDRKTEKRNFPCNPHTYIYTNQKKKERKRLYKRIKLTPDPLPFSRIQAGGAFTFVTSMAGWWIFFAIMLASLDFPFSIPVGDLSHIIKGASEKRKVEGEV